MTNSIYIATSLKNIHYDKLVVDLRSRSFEVFDWRFNLIPWIGFNWTPEDFRLNLFHRKAAFEQNKKLLDQADICILLLPCGGSAHIEAGYFAGLNKPLIVVLEDKDLVKPELMYLFARKICIGFFELFSYLEVIRS